MKTSWLRVRAAWRRFWAALILQPFQLPLVVALGAIAVVFTIWPEALDHAPIAFEKRGVVHHVWHYSLLAGSFVALYGMFSEAERRLRIEFAGLLTLLVVVALNTIALVADTLAQPPGVESGLGLALRFAVLAGFGVRLYTVIKQPTIHVSLEPRAQER